MVDHIAFICTDPEAQAAMLEKFGYEVKRRTVHHGASVELVCKEQPELVIELCRIRPTESLGFNHICLKVENAEKVDEMVENGLTIDKPLHLSKDSGRMITNHHDEDGNKWQITT